MSAAVVTARTISDDWSSTDSKHDEENGAGTAQQTAGASAAVALAPTAHTVTSPIITSPACGGSLKSPRETKSEKDEIGMD